MAFVTVWVTVKTWNMQPGEASWQMLAAGAIPPLLVSATAYYLKTH